MSINDKPWSMCQAAIEVSRNAHQSEVDDSEHCCPEASVDREDDELEDHLPGAGDGTCQICERGDGSTFRNFTS